MLVREVRENLEKSGNLKMGDVFSFFSNIFV
jgi:hypothetical protein